MLKIYKASAGSGKTYTLAYEYIRTLLGVKNPEDDTYRLNHTKVSLDGVRLANRHRHILAITFTNKATEEMKRRIIKELHILSSIPPRGAKDADFAPRLCRELRCSRRQLADSAALALKELLDTYSDFNVTTIDSFFQRVLRTFARELDRQGDFSVEIDDTTMLQMTVNTMLDDFNRNPNKTPALKEWLIDLMINSVEEGSKANFLNRSSGLYSRLIKLASQICDEKFKPYTEGMRQYLGVGDDSGTSPSKLTAVVDKLHKLCREITDRLALHVNEMWSDLAADGVTSDMLRKGTVYTRFLTEYLPGKKVPAYGDVKNETMKGIIDGKDPFKKNFNGNDIHRMRVREELRHAVEAYVSYYDYLALLKALPQLSLLAYAWKYLDNIIADNNTVLLSDTNHLIYRILGAGETPFVYERMGVNLTNFLIDEFQDTSKMQWDNLRPLVEESLSHKHDNLIIGDEKQSIYRFRNADSSLLHTQVANEDFPDDTKVEGDEPGQNTNWRSAADVVRFNNTLFTALAKKYDIDSYGNVIQQIAEKKADLPGYVRFINSTLLAPAPNPAETANPGKTKVSDEDIINRMAEEIRRQHDEGGYEWSDIAVLVNRNVEGAKVIAGLTSPRNNIPVISSDSMLLRKSTAVMMVVSILQIYALGHSSRKVTGKNGNIYPDTVQTAEIISQYKYLRQHDADTCASPRDAIAKAIDKAAGGESHAEEIVRRLISSRPSSLVSLIETVIHEFLTKDQREEQATYLAAFEDFALEWSERFPSSLSGFLEAWEQQKDKLSVSSASDIDAVTVLTIHKSKGLGYDCVHIPFGSWSEAKGEYNLWIPFPKIPGLSADVCPPAVFVELRSRAANPDSIFNAVYESNKKEELVDNLNKTYVAYTRAGRELIVYYDPDKDIGATLKAVFDKKSDAKDNTCLLNWPDDVIYDPATGNLAIGEPTHKVNSPERKTESRSLGEYEVTLNHGVDIYTLFDDNSDDIPVADSSDEYSHGSADDFADEKSRLRGIAFHDIISRVITAEDTEAAVRYHAMHKDIATEEEEYLLSEIKRMLGGRHPKIGLWFAHDADVLTEQTIYLPDTKESPRVDRIVRYPDGSVDIIDYKFTTTSHSGRHKEQVAKYMDYLSAMGYDNVRGYLWYPLISPDNIIEVKKNNHS